MKTYDRILNHVQQTLEANLDLMKRLPCIAPNIAHAAQILVDGYRGNGKAIFFGNGGSAADAQHLAAEMVCRFYRDRGPLPALALHTNTSAITAIGNDYNFDEIFSRQIRAFATVHDVAIALSTSGRSENVLRAARLKTEIGFKLVVLTGQELGELAELADVCISIPDSNTPRIQECHILVGHILCDWVEQELFPIDVS